MYPCIGIGFGRVLELTDDVFGDEVNIAFKLGEAVATKREILLSEGALTRARSEGAELSIEERTEDLGGVPVRYYVLGR